MRIRGSVLVWLLVCFLLVLPAFGQFPSATSFPASSSALSSIASGDFNSDGNPDIAVVSSAGVTILLGNGDGTFGAPKVFGAGPNPAAVAVGDFNFDGRPDLAVANLSGKVEILLGNGDGTFQAPMPYTTGIGSNAIVVADLNGDGYPDIATADVTDGTVSVLFGSYDGTFQPRSVYFVGTGPTAIAAGTLQGLTYYGSGKDLAVATANGVVVLLRNGNNFVVGGPYASGQSPQSIAIADLEGYGYSDIVLGSGSNVLVLAGNGTGTFPNVATYAAGPAISSVQVTDLNNDGSPDIIALSRTSNSAVVLLNDGFGSFTPGRSFEAGGSPVTAVADDFNFDFVTDLIVATGKGDVRVLLGNGDGTFFAPYNSAYDHQSANGASFADLNGDGNSDAVIADATARRVNVVLGAGNGTFTDGTAVQFGAGEAPQALALAMVGYNPTLPDLIVATSIAVGNTTTNTLYFYRLNIDPTTTKPNGTFTQYDIFSLAGIPSAIAVANFESNHGAFNSIAVAERNKHQVELISSGDGLFVLGAFPIGLGPQALAAADFNGDGKIDLAAVDCCFTPGLSVILGDGTGAFAAPVFTSLSNFPKTLAAADLNGDGKADVVVKTSNSFTVFIGNGDGSFQTGVSYAVPGTSDGLVLADLNGDGKLDVATVSSDTGEVFVAYGVGDGTFSAPTKYWISPGAKFLYATDLNLDGANDLVFLSTQLTAMLNGGGVRTTLSSSSNPAQYQAPLTFTATVTALMTGFGQPTGTVVFSDGNTSLGSAPLISGQATLDASALSVGSHDITATYSGDANFAAAQIAGLKQVIDQAATTTAVSVYPATTIYGQTVTFTALVTPSTSGVPTGTITFTDGTTTIATAPLDNSGQAAFSSTALTVGSHTITATYSGDTNYLGGSGTASVQVNAIPTSVSLQVTPTVTVTEQATLTASVTSSSGVPTGSVTFYDGATNLGSATLNTSGVGTLSVSLSAGTHSITAQYGGATTFLTSTTPAPAPVVVSVTTTTSLTANTSTGTAGFDVVLTATVTAQTGTPAGSVAFFDGATNIGTAVLGTNGTASLTISTIAAGTHSFTAQYVASGTFLGSSSTAASLTLTAVSTTTILSASASSVPAGQPVTLTATVSSGSGTPSGTVMFLDGSTTVGTTALNSSGVASLTVSSLAGGAHAITAQFGGTITYASSASAAVSLNVADYTLTANPTSATMLAGQTATFTITVTPLGGFNSPVNFSCGTLPLLATCTFSPNPVTPNGGPATTTLTIRTTAAAMVSPSLNAGTRPSANHQRGLLALWLTFGSAGIAGLVWCAPIGRRLRWLAVALLLVLLALMPACGDSARTPSSTTPTRTPAGVAQISVNASAGATGGSVGHTLSITITVQ